MSNNTLTFGQAVHPALASLGTLSAIGRVNVARMAMAQPRIAGTGIVHGPRRAPCPTCKGRCSVHLFGRADAPRVVCGSCGGSGQAGLITCG
jgi:DnaJ-class molecular chaperone